MRFALMKGPSQYGSLRLHIDQLAQALIELGHDARVADMAADDRQEQLERVILDPADCYFSFCGGGADLKILDRSAYDYLGAVFASMYVDHPLHHYPRVQAVVERNVALFLDRSHIRFIDASPAAAGLTQVSFTPPGANELPEPPDLSDEAYLRRDIPLMFTGTYRGPPQTPWRDWPESAAQTICEAVAGRMVADARLPILDALTEVLTGFGVELTPALFDNFAPLMLAPQNFADGYHRDALLHALGRAAIPIQIWGNGWAELTERYPSFSYAGVGSFQETLHNLRRTRVVLNINNGFIEGGHERVFTAMCAGATVFSDQSRFYEEAFGEGEDLVTFDWANLGEAADRLSSLITDPRRAGEIARSGALKAHAEHRWVHRARQLVELVDQAR